MKGVAKTLFESIKQNDIDAVKKFLGKVKSDVDVERLNDAVIYATTYNHIDILKLLLDHPDANVNYKNDVALRRATFQNNIDAVRVLIKHGADLKSKGSTDKTAIDIATEEGYDEILGIALRHATFQNNIDTVRVLIEHGADPESKGPTGKTAIDIATEKGYDEVLGMLKQ